jgi:hypothetical protein
MNFDFLILISVITELPRFIKPCACTDKKEISGCVKGCVIASNGNVFCFQKQDFYFDISMVLCLYS